MNDILFLIMFLLVVVFVIAPLVPPVLEYYGKYLDWVWDNLGDQI